MPLDKESRALLAHVATREAPGADSSLAELRAHAERDLVSLAEPGEPVAAVEELRVPTADGERALRAYRPRTGEVAPALLYLHGGGWTNGSLESEDAFCRALANGARCTVLSLDYRLAPEHPFPAALEDAEAALAWIVANARALDVDPARVGVCGQSAGGNLAASLTLRLAERGGPALALQALLCPGLDASMAQPSWGAFGSGYAIDASAVRQAWDGFRGDAPVDDPLVSPLAARPGGPLPPAAIVVAECDPLRDEALAYAALLARCGTDVRLRCWPGQVHSFFLYTAWLNVAARAVAELARELRAMLHGEPA